MKRFATHQIFCSPDIILNHSIIEQDSQQKITHLYNLDDSNTELAQTIFVEGIISSEFVSVKNYCNKEHLEWIKKEYQYYDFSKKNVSHKIIHSSKELLIDFGTNNTEIISAKLSGIADFLSCFTIYELISAVTFLPAKITANQSEIKINNTCSLLLWSNFDFNNKQLTTKTTMRSLS